jgi:hypothetical protein
LTFNDFKNIYYNRIIQSAGGIKMKNLIITFILLISLNYTASADQLAYITKDQAEKGAAFLRLEKEVLLFCGCCDNDRKVYLKVTGITVQHTGYKDYWEIIISGTNRNGENMVVEADLAYVHVNRNGKAQCAGRILNLECDPCVAEFSWESIDK